MSDPRSSVREFLASKEFVTGLLFSVIGFAYAFVGKDYGLGTARRMGPGYFPVMVGGALCLVGICMILRAALAVRPLDRAPKLHLRPLFFLTASVFAFALSINRFGLVVACISSALIAGGASPTTRWRETIIVAAAMAAFAAIVFVEFLGLPMRLWRW